MRIKPRVAFWLGMGLGALLGYGVGQLAEKVHRMEGLMFRGGGE